MWRGRFGGVRRRMRQELVVTLSGFLLSKKEIEQTAARFSLDFEVLYYECILLCRIIPSDDMFDYTGCELIFRNMAAFIYFVFGKDESVLPVSSK